MLAAVSRVRVGSLLFRVGDAVRVGLSADAAVPPRLVPNPDGD